MLAPNSDVTVNCSLIRHQHLLSLFAGAGLLRAFVNENTQKPPPPPRCFQPSRYPPATVTSCP
ncbi:hypothetical protein ABZP36_032146 [Zizania latifolia]